MLIYKVSQQISVFSLDYSNSGMTRPSHPMATKSITNATLKSIQIKFTPTMNLTTSKRKVHKRIRLLNKRSKYRINKAGESAALTKHFCRLRQMNEDNLPYQNIPWDVNKHFEAVDAYEGIVMTMFVLPQLIYVYPILFILLLPPVALNLLYITWIVTEKCNRIRRDTFIWKLHVLIQALLCIPALAIALLSLLVSRIAMQVFGLAYCILDDEAVARMHRNLRIIEPYNDGPMLLLYFDDLVSGVAGMVHRRGLLEFTSSFALSKCCSLL
jgi:hypothetical protein